MASLVLAELGRGWGNLGLFQDRRQWKLLRYLGGLWGAASQWSPSFLCGRIQLVLAEGERWTPRALMCEVIAPSEIRVTLFKDALKARLLPPGKWGERPLVGCCLFCSFWGNHHFQSVVFPF